MGDLFEFMDDVPPVTNLSTVRRLAQRAVALERRSEALEEELKSVKAELLILRREGLPDAMAEHGLSEFKLDDGSGVKIKNFAHGVLPKEPEARAEAMRLLEAHGGADLIKHEIVVTFQKKEHNSALALYNDLIDDSYNATISSDVHHGTLSAWCREKVKLGEQLDFEKLGVFVGRDTDISLPEKL